MIKHTTSAQISDRIYNQPEESYGLSRYPQTYEPGLEVVRILGPTVVTLAFMVAISVAVFGAAEEIKKANRARETLCQMCPLYYTVDGEDICL